MEYVEETDGELNLLYRADTRTHTSRNVQMFRENKTTNTVYGRPVSRFVGLTLFDEAARSARDGTFGTVCIVTH